MKTQNAMGNNTEVKEFFTKHLKALYWAEKKLVDTLPDMEEAATSSQLRNALSDHLDETKEHVARLERVFDMIGEERDTSKCKIMNSIADAGSTAINDTEDGSALRDVGLIFSGQMAEHYEITSYGNMIELAKMLGYKEAVNIFEQTLAEEKNADALLTQIAQNNINYKAATKVVESN